jgi:hypothetical protein
MQLVAGNCMLCHLTFWNTGVRTLEAGQCGSRLTYLTHQHFVQLFQIAMSQQQLLAEGSSDVEFPYMPTFSLPKREMIAVSCDISTE